MEFKNEVTRNDYLNYFGEDLELVIPDDDLGPNKVERFIERVEKRINSHLRLYYAKQEINDKNRENYKIGVMLTMYDILHVGWSNVKLLNDQAYEILKCGGFCNSIHY